MYSRLCLLSERYVFDILTYIHGKGSIIATDLQDIATNYRSVRKATDDLIDAGLVKMQIIDDDRMKKMFTLTPKGERVTIHLLHAKTELENGCIPFIDSEPDTVTSPATANELVSSSYHSS